MTNETYTTAAVLDAAGISREQLWAWRKRDLVTVDDSAERGWTRYSLLELLRVVAMAELTSYDLTPTAGARPAKLEGGRKNIGAHLIDHIAATIIEERESYERAPKRGRYLIATKPAPGDEHWVVLYGLSAADVSERLERDTGKTQHDTIGIVINTAKLWRRVSRAIAEHQEA